MTSQNDENLPASSSNAISLEAESLRPSQIDEVVQSGKRNRYSKAWKDFKLAYVDGVPYGQCKHSILDIKMLKIVERSLCGIIYLSVLISQEVRVNWG